MAKVTTFDDLCLEGLKDIYDSEHQITVALVSMLVAAGRIKDLGKIVTKLQMLSASLTNRSVAEVRSAVALTDEQTRALTEHIGRFTFLQGHVAAHEHAPAVAHAA